MRWRSPRAALREPALPAAGHDQASWEVKLLVDHREHLVAERTRVINRLRWHLHQLDPDLERAARRLPGPSLDQVAAWLAGTPTVDPGRHLPGADRHGRSADGAHRPAHRWAAPAGHPAGAQPAQPARLRGADGGQAHRRDCRVARFRCEACFAMHAGVAHPGQLWTDRRHRLCRGGNRQLNAAVHRIAITQLRLPGSGQAYYWRRAQGDGTGEAVRALKRRIRARRLPTAQARREAATNSNSCHRLTEEQPSSA